MQPFPAFLSPAGLEIAEREAIEIAQKLIRIDTTNTGKPETTVGERAAAEYVAQLLAEVGIEGELVDADPEHPERGRVSLVVRWPGSDPEQPGVVIHGHLDVVPPGQGWSHDPFGGEIADDVGDSGQEPYLHGRGAIDMKGQVAIALATIRQAAREGKKPPRDVVLALFSDEEAGGTLGAQYVVKNRPELFEGCSEVVGLEVGGFSFTLPTGKRVYLVQTGERGMGWGEFTTNGTQGHGSQVNHDNPLVKMVSALHQLTNEDSRLAAPLTDTMRQTLGTLADAMGMEFQESDPMAVIRELGPIAKWLENSIQSGFNLTQVHGGEKDNVVPGGAMSTVDVRPLPGQEAEFKATVERLLGDDVQKNWKVFLNGWENSLPVDTVNAMTGAIQEQDPEAIIVGWVMPAGTDAKAFKKNFPELPTVGFCPLQLPANLDFAGLFHAPEERVPLRTLRWGTRAFGGYLARCGVTPDHGGLDAPKVTRTPDGGWAAVPPPRQARGGRSRPRVAGRHGLPGAQAPGFGGGAGTGTGRQFRR